MLRSYQRLGLLILLAGTLGTSSAAQAQVGVARYGWGGWGGAVTPGRTAAGMGVLASGAGQYNVNTAQARSLNVQTAEQYNDYMWERSHQSAEYYYKKLAAKAEQGKQDYNQIHDRILNNPEDRDLQNGDTLNAILIEITAPKVYARTLQAASQPIPGKMVRQIPFNYASAALTYTIADLSSPSGVPTAFLDPAFKDTRDNLRATADQLVKETEGSQPPRPETIKRFRDGLDAAKKILQSATLDGSAERRDGENYLKALYGLSRMMEMPSYEVLLAGVEKLPSVPLREVLSFMHSFNLRFGPAKTPAQREIYSQLYGMLSNLHQPEAPVARQSPPQAPPSAPQKPDSRITNFFSKMDYSQLNPPKGPAPPPAGLAP